MLRIKQNFKIIQHKKSRRFSPRFFVLEKLEVLSEIAVYD